MTREFLAADWPDDGRVLLHATPDTAAIVAGSIDVLPAAAEVAVTISAALTLAPASFVSLRDTPDDVRANEFLRGNATGHAIDWRSAAGARCAALWLA